MTPYAQYWSRTTMAVDARFRRIVDVWLRLSQMWGQSVAVRGWLPRDIASAAAHPKRIVFDGDIMHVNSACNPLEVDAFMRARVCSGAPRGCCIAAACLIDLMFALRETNVVEKDTDLYAFARAVGIDAPRAVEVAIRIVDDARFAGAASVVDVQLVATAMMRGVV
jgi:hypothetical protein